LLIFSRFDSNYHYVVPEFSDAVEFKLNSLKHIDEFKEAKEAGIITRPVVLGPISFLLLGKRSKDASPNFNTIDLLPKLLPIYTQLLTQLKEAGAEWVQIDEPILVLDTGASLDKLFTSTYIEIAKVGLKVVLTTYFGRLDSNISFVAKLPISGLHIDLDREPQQLESVVNAVKTSPIALSLGLVSGRNIWKTDLTAARKLGELAVEALGQDRVIVSTSSSLLHTPVTLASETKLKSEQKDWFSFALEKASEVSLLAAALSGSQESHVISALEANKVSIQNRRHFEQTSDDKVRRRMDSITDEMLKRKAPFVKRREAQKAHLDLPKFPTTTIGSFPVGAPPSKELLY
jgi:5-methyltetrahydropteroyltriglutamate--homocysteine methyltransferase